MARPERFELPTTWFVARYSIQLSYGRLDRTFNLAFAEGFLPFRSQYKTSYIGGEGGIRTLDEAINPILP